MSTATLTQPATDREAERAYGPITIRVSVVNGETWLALDRQNHDGTIASIGVRLDDDGRWIVRQLMEGRT